MRFWYTDLSKDSGQPWFSCHLEIGTAPNGNPKIQIDKCFRSLLFWRIRLLIEATKSMFEAKRKVCPICGNEIDPNVIPHVYDGPYWLRSSRQIHEECSPWK